MTVHTEEQAKELWCPFTRVALEWAARDADPPMAEPQMVAATVNRGDGLSAKPLCIASQCMAWRWAKKINPDYHPSTMTAQWPHDPRKDTPLYVEDRTRGGCGLAGQP